MHGSTATTGPLTYVIEVSWGSTTSLGCPHARPHWSVCPWCTGLNTAIYSNDSGIGESHESVRFPAFEPAQALRWWRGRSLELSRRSILRGLAPCAAHRIRVRPACARALHYRREPGRPSRSRRRRRAAARTP